MPEEKIDGYYENFNVLTPVSRLSNGIGIYDKTSFPNNLRTARLVDAPAQPQIVNVEDLQVLTDRLYSSGPKTVLTFHGHSTKRYWRQTFSPHRDVEDIIKEVEKEGIKIDALAICNPGKYVLERDGIVPYTYAQGIASFNYSVREDGLFIGHFDPMEDCKLIIKTGEKIKPVVYKMDDIINL